MPSYSTNPGLRAFEKPRPILAQDLEVLLCRDFISVGMIYRYLKVVFISTKKDVLIFFYFKNMVWGLN